MASIKKDYLPIVADDGSMDEKAAYYYCKGNEAKRAVFTKLNIVLGSAVLIGVFLLGFASSHLIDNNNRRVAPVYDTEFAPATEAAELEQVGFFGSPIFDDNGDAVLNYTGGERMRYTGLPVEDVDAAWEDLIGTRYFLISDEEAFQAWGPDIKHYYRHPDTPEHKGGYVAGLDALHTLHCVNRLRRALYKDHYPEGANGNSNFQQYHIDHCLETLRQSIQCSGDMTPIPTRWRPGLGRSFIDSNQVHTCRKFSKIREWVLEWEKGHHKFGHEWLEAPNEETHD